MLVVSTLNCKLGLKNHENNVNLYIPTAKVADSILMDITVF